MLWRGVQLRSVTVTFTLRDATFCSSTLLLAARPSSMEIPYLGHRGADVGQLDDVPLGCLGQLTQPGKLVCHPVNRYGAIWESESRDFQRCPSTVLQKSIPPHTPSSEMYLLWSVLRIRNDFFRIRIRIPLFLLKVSDPTRSGSVSGSTTLVVIHIFAHRGRCHKINYK